MAAGGERQAARLRLGRAEDCPRRSPARSPCRCCTPRCAGVRRARRAGLGARARGAADRGDHRAQRHDGRGDDGADRARAGAAGAGRAQRAHRVAAGRRGRAGDRLRREAAGVGRGAAGARAARLAGAAAAARRAPRCVQLALATVVYVAVALVVADRRRCCSPRTTGRGRTAPPTAAPGTPRSSSTASTASRASRWKAPRPPTSRAATTPRRRRPSATRSRSRRPPPRACSPASARSRASGSAWRCSPACCWAARRWGRCCGNGARVGGRRSRPTPLRARSAGSATQRLRLALLAGLMLWLLTGIALFSDMAACTPATPRLHARGRGHARDRPRVGDRAPRPRPPARAERDAARGGAVRRAAAVRDEHRVVDHGGRRGGRAGARLERLPARGHAARRASPRWRSLCLLAIPLWASLSAVRENVSDTNPLGILHHGELAPLSAYLRAHQGSAYYEAAFDSGTKMGELVERDARPILVLTTLEGRRLHLASRGCARSSPRARCATPSSTRAAGRTRPPPTPTARRRPAG